MKWRIALVTLKVLKQSRSINRVEIKNQRFELLFILKTWFLE